MNYGDNSSENRGEFLVVVYLYMSIAYMKAE